MEDRPVTRRLKEKGLDVEFLAWLEGPEDRLPPIHHLAKVKPAELAAALRAAEWLASVSLSSPELIHPFSEEEWSERYGRLSSFLLAALRHRLCFHESVNDSDLQVLERVINTVVAEGKRAKYLRGIRHLCGQGQPIKLPPGRARRSGGVRQSERVRRMRAAAEYVSSVSRKFYVDLAAFWNECQDREYYPDEIRSKLLRGLHRGAKPPAGTQELGFWRCIYERVYWPFFPGPLP